MQSAALNDGTGSIGCEVLSSTARPSDPSTFYSQARRGIAAAFFRGDALKESKKTKRKIRDPSSWQEKNQLSPVIDSSYSED